MPAPTSWILVGNSGYAEFFELKGKTIKLLEHLEHIEGRQKVTEILSDKPGKAYPSANFNQYPLGEGHDVHDHERTVFAHQLARKCYQGKVEHLFDRLVVIAPPHFLGILRQVMSHERKPLLYKEIIKDLPDELPQRDKIASIYHYLEID